MKFLVTGANGDIALSIKEIIKRNFKNSIIHGCEINLNGKGKFFFDKVIKVPKSNDNDFIRKFNNLSKKYDLIVPTVESEIKVFSKNYKKINKNKFLLNNQKIIDLFLDKLKTHQFLKEKKIGNLKFTDYLSEWKKYKFPMFLKLREGAGNQNYKVLLSKKDIPKSIKNSNQIIQEYLNEQKEYTACLYSYLKIKKIIIFERILDKDKSFYIKYVSSKSLEKKLLMISKLINFNGSINIQFKILNNKLKIFEINPRLSSTVNMRDILGFKDCVWWIKDFLNIKNKLNNISYKKNTKMIRYEKIKIFN
jgi:carbamoyl-phosphate synthase large subunit